MKLKINNRKKNGKGIDTGRLNNVLLKNPVKISKRKSKNTLRLMKGKHNIPKSIRCSKSDCRKIYSEWTILKKLEKAQVNNLI